MIKNLDIKTATPSFLGMLNVFDPALNVYEKSDPNLDNYGMTGVKDLTDTDRLADAINNAEATGDITQGEFDEAHFLDPMVVLNLQKRVKDQEILVKDLTHQHIVSWV